jgi:Domain of unknown function (DUF4424)
LQQIIFAARMSRAQPEVNFISSSLQFHILADMAPIRPSLVAVCLITAAFIVPNPARGDDSAAAIAAGGLVPRRETRIVMAKEVLQISSTKIVVDYDFRNDSDQDVTTEVAFPIPPYENDWVEQEVKAQSFADFRLWINNAPAKFQSEAKAFLKGKDVTSTLLADRIDVASFGHFEDAVGADHVSRNRLLDIERLPKTEQERLYTLGLFDSDPDNPSASWTVHLQYHWTQTFPAHSITHIRHQYTPAEGFQYIQLAAFEKALARRVTARPMQLFRNRGIDDFKALASFCPEPSFLRGMIHAVQQEPPDSGYYAYPQWVDFILTSANTWKQPIEDFTLIIERGKPLDGYGKPMEGVRRAISFCSPENAPVTRLDANHFQVHLTNFIPQSELHIGFFDFDLPSTAAKAKPVKK